MEHIINPAWFYWINLVNGILDFLVMVLIFSAILLGVLGIGVVMNCDEPGGDTYQFCKKWAKRLFVVIAVAAVSYLFIPCKDTLIEMQVAKIATVDNAKLTVDALKSAVDYIINAINSLK